MALILRSPRLARLEDETLAYSHAIITNSTPPAGETVAQSSARQAIAALFASVTVLRAAIALHGRDSSAEARAVALAVVDTLDEQDDAPDRLLTHLERLL